MPKQAGLNAEQREEVNAALSGYGAHLTEDDRIAKGGKVMSVRLEVRGGRLRVEGGGNLLASYPASRAGRGISDFVKAFWFWTKAPVGMEAKRSPKELDDDVEVTLRHERSGGALCRNDGRGCCADCGVSLVRCHSCGGVGYHRGDCPDRDAP